MEQLAMASDQTFTAFPIASDRGGWKAGVLGRVGRRHDGGGWSGIGTPCGCACPAESGRPRRLPHCDPAAGLLPWRRCSARPAGASAPSTAGATCHCPAGAPSLAPSRLVSSLSLGRHTVANIIITFRDPSYYTRTLLLSLPLGRHPGFEIHYSSRTAIKIPVTRAFFLMF